MKRGRAATLTALGLAIVACSGSSIPGHKTVNLFDVQLTKIVLIEKGGTDPLPVGGLPVEGARVLQVVSE